MMEEAMRNGTYIPPALRAKKLLGEKPALHDAYLDFREFGANLCTEKSREILSDTPDGMEIAEMMAWDDTMVRLFTSFRCAEKPSKAWFLSASVDDRRSK